MISCTKLRVIQQGVIFYDNSHLRETMVERKLISTTDKQGANRPRKDKYNQVSMKTAGHSRNDTSPSGHSRCQGGMNESYIQQNAKHIIDWINLNSNYERLEINKNAEEEGGENEEEEVRKNNFSKSHLDKN